MGKLSKKSLNNAELSKISGGGKSRKTATILAAADCALFGGVISPFSSGYQGKWGKAFIPGSGIYNMVRCVKGTQTDSHGNPLE